MSDWEVLFVPHIEVTFYERMIDVTIAADWQQAMPNAQCGLKSTNSFALYNSIIDL